MARRGEVMIAYHRTGGRRPPRDRERLFVYSDGRFILWRSIGAATYPPTPIGEFAGLISPGELSDLQSLIENCSSSGSIQITPVPDAVLEHIEFDGVHASLSIHDEPEGDWGILINKLRDYLAKLTIFPQSAIGIELISDGSGARLVFLGNGQLQLDLTSLKVRAVQWNGYTKDNDWTAPSLDSSPSRILASKGWYLDLPFYHEFKIESLKEIVAYVQLVVFDSDEPIPVSLETPRKAL